MSYNAETKAFNVCFFPTSANSTAHSTVHGLRTLREDSGNADITELFVHFDLQYPRGIDITVSPALTVHAVDEARNLVYIRNRNFAELAGAEGGAVMGVACIDITHKPM